MLLTFSQGIARYQTDVYGTPTFLRKSAPDGEYIDLVVSPDPTIIVFAHRAANYLIEEPRTVLNAWGPFPTGGTKYLYWDINLLDASLTRGFTSIPPFVSAVAPSNPVSDTHWFSTGERLMRVWNGFKWVEKVRVFAATYSFPGNIVPSLLGSQVNLNGEFESGNLVLDAYNKPLRQSDGTFVTSSTTLSIINSATNVKFETEVVAGMADEYIPKFSWVQIRKNRRLILGRSNDWKSRVAGIVTKDLFTSEVGNVTPNGLVRNDQWNWPADSIGRPVFCNASGGVVLTPPSVGVSQICGYVYDVDAIEVDIDPVTILDDITNQVEDSEPQPNLIPIAGFSQSTSTGTAPLTVNFTNTSIHGPSLIEWDFENDGVFEANGEVVTHIYDTPGSYDVRMRATNAFGMDEEIKSQVVTVNQPSQSLLKTNLGISLGGPIQGIINQPFTISVIASNAGMKQASEVQRIITVPDVNSIRPTITLLPTGSTTTRVNNNSTVIVLPVLETLASGAFENVTFKIACSVVGTVRLFGSILSPETDSTLGDNVAELFVTVK